MPRSLIATDIGPERAVLITDHELLVAMACGTELPFYRVVSRIFRTFDQAAAPVRKKGKMATMAARWRAEASSATCATSHTNIRPRRPAPTVEDR